MRLLSEYGLCGEQPPKTGLLEVVISLSLKECNRVRVLDFGSMLQTEQA